MRLHLFIGSRELNITLCAGRRKAAGSGLD